VMGINFQNTSVIWPKKIQELPIMTLENGKLRSHEMVMSWLAAFLYHLVDAAAVALFVALFCWLKLTHQYILVLMLEYWECHFIVMDNCSYTVIWNFLTLVTNGL